MTTVLEFKGGFKATTEDGITYSFPGFPEIEKEMNDYANEISPPGHHPDTELWRATNVATRFGAHVVKHDPPEEPDHGGMEVVY